MFTPALLIRCVFLFITELNLGRISDLTQWVLMCLQTNVQERICLAKDDIFDIYFYQNDEKDNDNSEYVDEEISKAIVTMWHIKIVT